MMLNIFDDLNKAIEPVQKFIEKNADFSLIHYPHPNTQSSLQPPYSNASFANTQTRHPARFKMW